MSGPAAVDEWGRPRAGMESLRRQVIKSRTDTYTTRGGVVKTKTAKQKEIEARCVEAVVQFAFDHGGFRGPHLAPFGLYSELAGI